MKIRSKRWERIRGEQRLPLLPFVMLSRITNQEEGRRKDMFCDFIITSLRCKQRVLFRAE